MSYEPIHLKRWSMPDSYFGATWPNHYSSGFGRSRDSDDLEESNFVTALAELGGESEIVTVVRESHWAVGWVEWIAIEADGTAESDKALEIADGLQERMENYPVLDETDFITREMESANTIWCEWYSWEERIKYMREHASQFEFRDLRDMLACARGEYFVGYASDLIF